MQMLTLVDHLCYVKVKKNIHVCKVENPKQETTFFTFVHITLIKVLQLHDESCPLIRYLNQLHVVAISNTITFLWYLLNTLANLCTLPVTDMSECSFDTTVKS